MLLQGETVPGKLLQKSSELKPCHQLIGPPILPSPPLTPASGLRPRNPNVYTSKLSAYYFILVLVLTCFTNVAICLTYAISRKNYHAIFSVPTQHPLHTHSMNNYKHIAILQYTAYHKYITHVDRHF